MIFASLILSDVYIVVIQLFCRQIARELSEQMISRKLHEDTWYKRKELLDDAEEERRRQLMDEEKKLVEQRKS